MIRSSALARFFGVLVVVRQPQKIRSTVVGQTAACFYVLSHARVSDAVFPASLASLLDVPIAIPAPTRSISSPARIDPFKLPTAAIAPFYASAT